MNKTELIDAIATAADLPKASAGRALDAVIDSITEALKKGDQVLFYHSNEGVEIVGIAKVAKEFYQDPTTDDEAWVVVDFKPYKKLKKAVPLDIVKKDKRLANMDLVRLGRLSVQTVKPEEWDIIMELAGEK